MTPEEIEGIILMNWTKAFINTQCADDTRLFLRGMLRRELALRNIKAVHTRYTRGELTADDAVNEMEGLAVSVWQQE